MKILTTLTGLAIFLILPSCGSDSSSGDPDIDTPPAIETQSADYEDSDQDNDGTVEYEEASARGRVTTQTTNYAQRADSLQTLGDTLVDPTYTDDEYEAAYSTSTTNPKNQVEGGIIPGKKQ